MTTHEDFQPDILSDDEQNDEATEDIQDYYCPQCTKKRVLKTKINNLVNINELQGITIRLLEHKSLLLHIKRGRRDVPFSSVLEEQINDRVNEVLETSDGMEKKIIDREEDTRIATQKIVADTISSFTNYSATYIKCIEFIKKFYYVASKQKVSNMYRTIRKMFKSVSTWSEHIISYGEFLGSTKAFHECKSISLYHGESTEEETVNDMVDFFVITIEEAESAYSELKSIMVDFICF